jgi:hypothetical protein
MPQMLEFAEYGVFDQSSGRSEKGHIRTIGGAIRICAYCPVVIRGVGCQAGKGFADSGIRTSGHWTLVRGVNCKDKIPIVAKKFPQVPGGEF